MNLSRFQAFAFVIISCAWYSIYIIYVRPAADNYRNSEHFCLICTAHHTYYTKCNYLLQNSKILRSTYIRSYSTCVRFSKSIQPFFLFFCRREAWEAKLNNFTVQQYVSKGFRMDSRMQVCCKLTLDEENF